MKLSGRALLISLALFALTAPAATSDWKPYGNARFQYWIDIPPDFTGVKESENSDGGSSSSPDGRAELRVWGSYLTEGSFAAEVNWRVDQDHSNGWIIAFRKQKANWAVWSGTKGDRIFYERAIPVCDDATAYFRLEYDKEREKAFDPIVFRLVKSLRSGRC